MDDGHDPPPFLRRIFFEVDEVVTVKCADGSHSQALRDRVFQDGSIWYSTGKWPLGAAAAAIHFHLPAFRASIYCLSNHCSPTLGLHKAIGSSRAKLHNEHLKGAPMTGKRT
jgi:hypothetical protein